MTEAQLRFACEQLREWGGLPEAEIRRIYEAETKRPAGEREGQGDEEARNGRRNRAILPVLPNQDVVR